MITQNKRFAGSVTSKGITLPLFQGDKYLQAFNAHKILEGGEPFVYFPVIKNLNAPTEASKIWRGDVSEVGFTNGQIEAPVFTLQARTSMILNEAKNFDKQVEGTSLEFVLDYSARQGLMARDNFVSVFGVHANKGQGLYGGSTNETLPADSNSKQKLTEYDINELFQFLKNKLVAIMGNTFNFAQPYFIMGSYQTINYLRSTYIPLSSYQKEGAGVSTIAEALEGIAKASGSTLLFIENDNLLPSLSGLSSEALIIGAKGLTDSEGQDAKSRFGIANIPNSLLNTVKCEGAGVVVQNNAVENGVQVRNYELATTPGVVLREGTVVSISFTYA